MVYPAVSRLALTAVTLLFATFASSQDAPESVPTTPGSEQSVDHAVIRDAHRAAMQQQMEAIREIEDPEERARRMEELHAAMNAMREAMQASHQDPCAEGQPCAAGGQHHGPHHAAGGSRQNRDRN